MAIMTSGQLESGQIIFAGSDLVPEQMLFFCTGSGLEHHCWIWIRSVFVQLAWFQYQYIILDPLGLNEFLWSQIRPPSGKTDWDHIQHFYSGPVVITWSESDPFFAHLAQFLYWCVIQDPLDWTKPDLTWFRQNRSGIQLAFLFRARWSSPNLNQIWSGFCTYGPAGSSIDALSRIRLDWTKQDLICLRRNRLELRPAFLFRARCSWPNLNQIRYCTSGMVLISVRYPGRICLDWTKPDLTHYQRNRSGPYPAFLFRAGCSCPFLN